MASLFHLRIAALIFTGLVCLAGVPAYAQQSDAPVDFSADNLSHDDQTRTVTATGNVEMTQEGRTLKADTVIYNLATDQARAIGNVVLTDVNGDVHVADELELSDKMKDGYVNHLQTTFSDGSRFWAKQGERKGGSIITMKDASYTPCEPCKENPDAEPVWKINAGTLTHNKEEQRIIYHNATFDVMGVPVFWVPYFSHPDGTVEQKSGFLLPSFGFSSDLGFQMTNQYYYAIAPDRDMTVGVRAMTKQAPLLMTEYRQRFDNAVLDVSGGVTYSSRIYDDGGVDVHTKDKVRGHLMANGLMVLNEKWRAGMELELVSDDQYMRQYDFTNKDVLENQVYVERFSGRDYAVGRLLSFRDIRVAEDRREQPHVLPEVIVSFLGEPGQTLGGRWSVDLSALGLYREGQGQDMHRFVGELGWQRRLTSDTGLLTTVDLKLRGDAYYTTDRDVAYAGSGRRGDGEETRGFASANIVTSYPLVKNLERAQLMIAPEGALMVSPNLKSRSGNIPNEDSQDVQLEVYNLFDADRFPGYDRIEDGIHTTYGVRTGLYGHDGSKGEVFVGQSYRIDGKENPFPYGSGLSNDRSDLVGEVIASYKNMMNVTYQFRLDDRDLSSRRHELDAQFHLGALSVGTQYFYARKIEGAELSDDREQIRGWAAYRFLPEWQGRTGILYDLSSKEEKGMREAAFGIDYLGQCFTLSGTLTRNLMHDISRKSNTEVMFRLGLKNLGEFSTSGVELSNSERN